MLKVYFAIFSIMGIIYGSTMTFIFDKDSITPRRFFSVSTFDYFMYYSSRIILVISIISIIVIILNYKRQQKQELERQKREEDEIQRRTTRIVKHYFKGKVISKDKTSRTYGNSDNISTSVNYCTSVRLDTPDQRVIYFYGDYIYSNCMEGEEVGILLVANEDDLGTMLKGEYEFLGPYSKIQKLKKIK